MGYGFGNKISIGKSKVSTETLYYPNIVYLGRENGTVAGGYAVQNWSLTSTPKKFSASNKYGNSGYYQIRPTTAGAGNITEAVGSGNNLGISAGTFPTLYSAPTFLTISGSAGTFVNFSVYPTFLGFDGSTIYRQGALSVPVSNGPFNSPSGSNASYYGDAFSITLTENAIFIIGIAVDSVSDGQYSPKYVSIYSPQTMTVFSASLPRNAIPRMPFFGVSGRSGDTFNVAMWQDTGTQSVSPFSLITFDRIQ